MKPTIRTAACSMLMALIPAVAAATTPPRPAPADFAADFAPPLDAELGYLLGGFGGLSGQTTRQVPVIFVHGNTSDACDWQLVRDDFRAAGWTDQALWALSYHGLGANQGAAPARPDPRCSAQRKAGDGLPRPTSNDVNVPDLRAFIHAVRRYTGSERFSIVAHSLGVTLARKTLQTDPELRRDLLAFVGIAGGNHGTSLCPPGTEALYTVCAELAAAGSAWLEALNGPDGRWETWPGARWLSLYDGGGQADVAFTGALADSPRLEGAQNRAYPGVSHNDLRVRADIVEHYRTFLEQTEAAADHRLRLRRQLLGK